MSCQDICKDLARYVSDSLSEERRSELREHLSSCHGCQAEAERYQGLLGQLDELESFEAPENLSASTMELIRARAPRPEAPSLWERLQTLISPQVLMPALGGVALACFFLLGGPTGPSDAPSTASLSGIASVETSDGARSNAAGLQNVPYGATIVAFAPNDSLLSYPGGARIALKPNARARIEEQGLQLLAGRAECLFGAAPFQLVWKGHRIDGALALVELSEDAEGNATLKIQKGMARLQVPGAAPRSLSAGETVTLRAVM